MATREASSAKLDVEGYTSCRNALSFTSTGPVARSRGTCRWPFESTQNPRLRQRQNRLKAKRRCPLSLAAAAHLRWMRHNPKVCPRFRFLALRVTSICVLHGDERSQRAQGGSHGFCAQRACPRECARTHQRSLNSHVTVSHSTVVSNLSVSHRKQTTSASRNA